MSKYMCFQFYHRIKDFFFATTPKAIVIKLFGVIIPWTFAVEQDRFLVEHINDYLHYHPNELAKLSDFIKKDPKQKIKKEIDDKRGAAYFIRAVKEGRTSGKHLELQEMKWRMLNWGYETEQLFVPVFREVSRVFEKWKKKNIQVTILTSGYMTGVESLLEHTTQGNLNKFIKTYITLNGDAQRKFDVNTYINLPTKLNVHKNEIVFVTDDLEEAQISDQTGTRTILITRQGKRFPLLQARKYRVLRNIRNVF